MSTTPNPRGSKQNEIYRWSPALILVLFLIFTGLRGIDFGFHWDEWTHAQGVKHTIETGVPLPGIYLYPGVSYWLSLASALPELITYQITGHKNLDTLLKAIEGKDYRIRTRAVFLITSALAVLLTYLLVLGWRKNILEALIAASVLALSWEFAYHIRWIAPDGVLVTFCTLTLLSVTKAYLDPLRTRWIWVAAASAGLAFGTKWPAGLFLIPVLMVGYLTAHERGDFRSRLVLGIKIILLFFAAYLMTTPATLFDWPQLWKYIKLQQDVYAGGLQGYAVPPGPVHFLKITEYFALVYPSKYKIISLSWFVLSGIGLYSLYKASPKMTVLFLSFPFLYVAFFSLQGMMVVRNYLVLGPFFAVLAARGATILIERNRNKIQKTVVSGAVLVLLAVNAFWLVHAAETIRQTEPKAVYLDLIRYIQDHPQTRFAVSKQVEKVLKKMRKGPFDNVTPQIDPSADASIFFAYEMLKRKGVRNVPANQPGLTITWFGPYEVNFNYYPTWQGSDRVLVVPLSEAKALGFPFSVEQEKF